MKHKISVTINHYIFTINWIAIATTKLVSYVNPMNRDIYIREMARICYH